MWIKTQEGFSLVNSKRTAIISMADRSDETCEVRATVDDMVITLGNYPDRNRAADVLAEIQDGLIHKAVSFDMPSEQGSVPLLQPNPSL